MLKSFSHNLLLVGIFSATILVAMFFVNAEHYRARNERLKQSRSVVAGEKISAHQEETYLHPTPVHLDAQIITSFVGGQDLAVETATILNGHQRFYIVGYNDFDYSAWQGESVSIEGVVVGLTCAYAKTVFGECVPEIMASSITKVSE